MQVAKNNDRTIRKSDFVLNVPLIFKKKNSMRKALRGDGK